MKHRLSIVLSGLAAVAGGTAIGVAPGRAEIVGNHTDYSEGYGL